MTDTEVGKDPKGKLPGRLFLRIGLPILGLFLALGGWMAYDVVWGPNDFPGGGSKSLFVSRGETFAEIADSLAANGMIRSRPWFVFVAKVFGGAEQMKVGKYEFVSGASNADIFFALREGSSTVLIPVTLLEGRWARRYASTLARELGIDSSRYMELVNDERFARSLGVARSSLEGYLLPETYKFSWQQSEESIVREQVRQFWNVFDDSLRLRARETGWSIHDAVTLASIIEGEVVIGEERARISGVYHNRLRKGMRLQADPTIQYFIENGPRRVTYSDLKIDHPYNTYRRKGLPPGPVNNPSRASLYAALYPEEHQFLYFVANGKGGHWFTSSYAEHLKYVRKFRRDRARREADSAQSASRKPGSNGM